MSVMYKNNSVYSKCINKSVAQLSAVYCSIPVINIIQVLWQGKVYVEKCAGYDYYFFQIIRL